MNRPFVTPRRLLLASFAVLAVVMIGTLISTGRPLRRDSVSALDEGGTTPDQAEGWAAPGSGPVEDHPRTVPGAGGPGSGDATTFTLRGQLVSDQSGHPVRGWVSLHSSGLRVFSGLDGRFILEAPGSARLSAGASGHEGATIEWERPDEGSDLDLGEVRLIPDRSVLVLVKDPAGRPVPAAQVRFVEQDASRPRIAGHTDEQGELRLVHGGVATVYATHPSGASELVQASGGAVLLVLRDPIRLGILEDATSAAPADTVELVLESTTWPRVAWSLVPESDGLCSTLVPRVEGGYRLRVPDRRWSLVPPDWMRENAPDWFIPGDPPSGIDGTTWIRLVDRGRRKLEVRSARTGALLPGAEAWLESWLEPPFRKVAGWQRLNKNPARAPGGVLSLHEFGLLLRDPGPLRRIVVTAPGHKAGIWESRGQPIPDSPIVVRLEAAQSRNLRLTNRRGDPIHRSVLVQEDGIVAWRGVPVEGRAGPFTWRGDAVQVGFERESRRMIVAEISAASLAREVEPICPLDADATLHLTLPHGVESIDVLCLSSEGPEFPGRAEGRTLVFDQLPAGSYWLASPSQVEYFSLLRGTGKLEPLVVLDRGQFLELDGSGVLDAEGPGAYVEARVTFAGSVPESLFVVPVPRDGNEGPVALSAGPGSPRFRVSTNGDYVIPLPWSHGRAAAVFVRQVEGGQLLPLGWGPLEGSSLDCGVLQLALEDSSTRVESVSIRPVMPGLSATGQVTWSFEGLDALNLGAISTGKHQLRVQYPGRAVNQVIEVRSGEEQRIVLPPEPSSR